VLLSRIVRSVWTMMTDISTCVWLTSARIPPPLTALVTCYLPSSTSVQLLRLSLSMIGSLELIARISLRLVRQGSSTARAPAHVS